MKYITLFFKHAKKYILLLFLLFLFITCAAFSYSNAVSTDICNSVFRLHVIANSDTKQDQNLKYIVRDEILKYICEKSASCSSKEEIIKIVIENNHEIKMLAQKVVLEQGYNYPINISIGNFEFPTKQYGDITLPCGLYDALKVEIGTATGQNWWCVMFPPLCFVDVSSGIVPEESKQIIKENISNEEYNLISNDNLDTKFKFKIVEILQSITIGLAK